MAENRRKRPKRQWEAVVPERDQVQLLKSPFSHGSPTHEAVNLQKACAMSRGENVTVVRWDFILVSLCPLQKFTEKEMQLVLPPQIPTGQWRCALFPRSAGRMLSGQENTNPHSQVTQRSLGTEITATLCLHEIATFKSSFSSSTERWPWEETLQLSACVCELKGTVGNTSAATSCTALHPLLCTFT